MSITFDSVGTWALTATSSTPTVAIPAGAGAGDLMIVVATWKNYDITASITGWTEIVEFQGGTTPATGNGNGSITVGAWYKVHDGSESDPTLTFSATPNPAGYVIIVFAKGASDTWDAPVPATSAISAAEAWTVTASSDPGITGGDVLVGLVGFTDNSILMIRGVDAVDAAGITWAEDTQQAPATHLDTSTGFDMSSDLVYRTASSGSSSAAPTQDGQLDNPEVGTALWLRLRVTASGGSTQPPRSMHQYRMRPR